MAPCESIGSKGAYRPVPTPLISMGTKQAMNNMLTGIKISKNGPAISHLFFADDSLIFCKANSKEASEITRILQIYELASGQKINIEKSAVLFSRNTSQANKQEVLQTLGNIQHVSQAKYLGLPMVIGRSKNSTFKFLKEKMIGKLQGWKGKMLSNAGKEVLLKLVALALPSYTMSVFKLPDGLCKALSNMMARFWWGNDQEDGIGRQIGNDRSTAIWKDRWVPNGMNGLIRLARPQNCIIDKVCELISNKRWNNNLIQSIFSREEAEQILMIPLSIQERQDRFVWMHSSSGDYTTKSGYAQARLKSSKKANKMQPNEGSSSRKDDPTLWHQGARSRVNGISHIEATINFLWQLWKARNACNFNKESTKGNLISSRALEEWLEYKQMWDLENGESKKDEPEVPTRTITKEFQDQHAILMFTDAAMDNKRSRGGLGIATKDHNGRLVKTWTIPTGMMKDAAILEAEAIRSAMLKALEEGWTSVLIHSDCKCLVDRINHRCIGLSLLDMLVDDIIHLSRSFW
ncbi:uncharacterized protein [Coffea arabica]|uniref:RNase H type-1 domain-containing protein n=1 Tax=Coffea arabica TaxID=13443 RepID=A0ABM4VMD8_COFAR